MRTCSRRRSSAAARKLYGGAWTATPPTPSFPQPCRRRPTSPRPRQLLTEAGFPNGFTTTFAFTAGQAATDEPVAALVKESLAQDRHPGRDPEDAGRRVQHARRPSKMPFFTDGATAWLPYTDYFFYLYFTRDQRWNFAT